MRYFEWSKMPNRAAVVSLMVTALLVCTVSRAASPEVIWSYVPGGELSGTPAYTRDGRVVFAAEDRWLYALDADGSLQWRYDLRRVPLTAPAVGRDGVVYIGLNPDRVVAVTPAGRYRWSVTGSGQPRAIVAAPGGTVYTVFSGGEVSARTTRGGLLWRHRLPHTLSADPVVTADGALTVATQDNSVAAFTHRGVNSWVYRHNQRLGVLAAREDGILLAGDSSGAVVALDSSGKPAWQSRALGASIVALHVDDDAATVAVSGDGSIARLSADGALQWTARPPGGISAVALSGDGNTYAVTAYGRMLVFDSRARLLAEEMSSRGQPLAHVALTPGGRLLTAGRDWVVDLVAAGVTPTRRHKDVLGQWSNLRGDARATGVARGYPGPAAADYADVLDYIYLSELLRSDAVSQRERALREIEARVAAGHIGASYAYVVELLLQIVESSSGSGGTPSAAGQPADRARALRVLAGIADGTVNSRIARVLAGEDSSGVRVAMLQTVGAIAADPDGDVAVAIDAVVRRPESGDREARAAARALQQIARFNRYPARQRAQQTLAWIASEIRFSRQTRAEASAYLRGSE